MSGQLTEANWGALIRRIESGRCTPFLGAGACAGALPLGADLANSLAKRYAYPFPDRDLARVAQYVATRSDPATPKEDVIELLNQAAAPEYKRPPDFFVDGEPHGVLAGLPFRHFITTNYDDFMFCALRAQRKTPRRAVCQWSSATSRGPILFESDPHYVPDPANPLVYHLHGTTDFPESLVLTEDDYLTFLSNISREPRPIPPLIEQLFESKMFLFIGYRLGDWNFRVLLRMLRPVANYTSIVVIPKPDPTDPDCDLQQSYLDDYFSALKIKAYWSSARDFCRELKQRWNATYPP